MQRQIRNTSPSYEIFAARPRPALCALAVLAGTMAAGPALAQTAAPTSDPLHGERRLLPLDDIMLLSWTQIDETSNFAAPNLDVLLTAGNDISGTVQAQPGGAGDLTFMTFGTAAGNLFAVPRDTIAVSIADQLHLYLGNTAPAWSGTMPNPASDARTALAGLIRPLMAMADVTGDGYAEIVVGTAGGGLQIATAVDPTDPTQGVRWGAQFDLTPEINTLAGAALVPGDFDGDGLAEVAVAFPAFVDSLVGNAFRVSIFDVDPTTLSLTFAHSATTDTAAYGVGRFPIRKVSLAAGDFDRDVSALGLPDDELVLTASGEDAQDSRFVIMTYDIAPDLQPSSEYSELYIPDCTGCGYMSTIAASGRLDWTGALEQAVVGLNHLNIDEGLATQEFWILRFSGDDGLEFDVVAQEQLAQDRLGDCVADLQGLAIGNFDRKTPTEIPTSLSIAVLRDYGLRNNVNRDKCSHTQQYHWMVDIWTVDPATLAVSEGAKLTGAENTGRGNQFRTLLTGDYQGGSLWVGTPTVVPLQDLAQLEVVLQAPPMHLDFIQPVQGTSPELLNLSFGLPGFNTKFTEASGTTTSTSHQSTTSNTFAEKESIDRSLSLGVPDVASVSVSLKASAQQTQQKVVAKGASTITSTVESITAATDLDDRLWYTMHDVDLYIYPILCPPDAANAGACGTEPSDVMFSVPQSQSVYSFVPGGTVEWYQPPHQVAQALSYPWTQKQLAALFPTATLDVMLATEGIPAGGPFNGSFTWSTGEATTTSIGKTRTVSTDTSVSISTDANALADVIEVGEKTSTSFAFSTSHSISTLNTTKTAITGSIGFLTNVPTNLRSAASDYAYDFDALVFGQTHPPCSNADPPSTVTCLYDEPTLDDVIKTQGTLWAGYTIDLAPDSSAGSWWTSSNTDYFTLHDIALSHPQRWIGDFSQTSGDNCLLDSSSSTQLCYVRSFDSLQRSDIWTNEFHQMKGFFVVPAVADGNGGFLEPQGPQTAVIDADGQVWLQARVHNYSFVATDKNGDGSAADGNALHVRFYAQEWDATNHVPLAGKPSVLVDEVVLDQCIPGQSTSTDTNEKRTCVNNDSDNNWLLVTSSKPFDPVADGIDPGTSGTYVLFWVVAWLEDSSGALVPEVVEHGLTGVPGELTSLTAAGQISQAYGNNIGFFHLPTFVCPSGLACANVAPADVAAAEAGLRIRSLVAPRKPIALHDRAEIKALLAAGDAGPGSVHVALYEGEPEAGGRIFDVELVPHLRANDLYQIRTNYRPDSCGPREIVLVADPGGGRAPVRGTRSVNVSADPRIELAALQSLFAAADLPRKQARAVAEDLRRAARALGRGKAMRGMAALEDLRGHARRSGAIPAIVEQIEARIDAFAACVADAGGVLAYASRLR